MLVKQGQNNHYQKKKNIPSLSGTLSLFGVILLLEAFMVKFVLKRTKVILMNMKLKMKFEIPILTICSTYNLYPSECECWIHSS